MAGNNFERLFSSLQIRDVEIPNRVVAAGMGWAAGGMEQEANLPTDMLAATWGARAADGLGLIITEPQSVHPTSTSTPRTIESASDAVIAPYRKLAEAVHAHGTKVIGQLNHAGHLGGTGYRLLPLWAPSAVRAPMGRSFPAGGGVLPHAMEPEEVAEIVEAFAAAAARNVQAGFDGVEINAAEGYLVAQFLSPLTNLRDDGYGGSVEARRRFLLEIVAAVRERIGAGPLLGVRIGTDTYIEGGFTEDDVGPLAAALAETGSVDYLGTTPLHPPHMGHEPGAYSELASAAREASGLPVLYMGWVDGPQTGERLLETGVCELVGMSRATLADSDLLRKTRAGAVETIRPCIACNQTCTGGGAGLGAIMGSSCMLNPMLMAAAMGASPAAAGGAPADTAGGKKMLVVGAGPAGVEAACLLAKKGHQVTVWERDDRVGGQLRVAARAPHRERMDLLADYYEGELERCGVTVELGRTATADDVRAFGADTVVVATGAFGHTPPVPGVDQPHVTDVRSIMRGHVEPGERVLVVIARAEHRFQGLTVAEYIAAQGKQVHVITDAFVAADLWEETSRLDTYRRLSAGGVAFSTMTELVAVRENQVEVRNRYSLQSTTLEADTVVLAFGDDADSGLLAELEDNGLNVHSAGDVVAPRDLQGAVGDANLLAMTI